MNTETVRQTVKPLLVYSIHGQRAFSVLANPMFPLLLIWTEHHWMYTKQDQQKL